jgi:hypothetical protein
MQTPNAFAVGGSLVWTQPKTLRGEYELRSGDDLIGQLRFRKLSGTLASAEVASQSWTFKREGFLNPRVTVRSPDCDVNLAIYRPHWNGGGILEIPGGHRIHWRCTSFWGSEWSFLQEDSHSNSQALIHFKHHDGIMKVSARLEIVSADSSMLHLPMLAALGWYLMLLNAQDAAMAAVTVATTG